MVYILLAPGFEEMEALVPADLLRRAGIETALVSLKGDVVPGFRQLGLAADLTLDQVDLSKAEMVVLPGGSAGVANLEAEPAVEKLVGEAVQRGIWVAAICAAPSLLGKWGHLQGKRAVCYPGWEGALAGAQYQPDCGVVADGKIITGRAAGSAFDFGFALIEALAGAEKAEEVRRGVLY